MKDTRFAVVNTLHFGRHEDYENDDKLTAILDKLDVEWIKKKDWNYELDFKEDEDLAVIDLKNVEQLQILSQSCKDKIYIDFKNHIIVPTGYECDD